MCWEWMQRGGFHRLGYQSVPFWWKKRRRQKLPGQDCWLPCLKDQPQSLLQGVCEAVGVVAALDEVVGGLKW